MKCAWSNKKTGVRGAACWYCVVLAGIFSLVCACQPEPSGAALSEGRQAEISVPLPDKVDARMRRAAGKIQAYVEIPQLDLRVDLIVGEESATSRAVGEFPPGRYTVHIVFEAASDFGEHVIAEGYRTILFGSGLNEVVFESSDYQYPDDDGDQYSNLTELEYDTSPSDGGDHPRAARVFATSVQGTGNLSSWPEAGGKTGLAAGDAICNTVANNAGLGGEWVAWLSDRNNDAFCRVQGFSGRRAEHCHQPVTPASAGPWVRMDGFPFAPDIRQLTQDLILYTPVMFNEFAQRLMSEGSPVPVAYWTGTSQFGISSMESSLFRDFGADCSGWNSDNNEESAAIGATFGGNINWTLTGDNTCDRKNGLLCIERGNAMPLPRFKRAGKRVFLSSSKGNGDLSSWPEARGKTGLSAGDEICRSLAKAASLDHADRFKAFLSDDRHTALDRLVSQGPWVRMDGVLFADSKADLSLTLNRDDSGNLVSVSGGPFSSLSITEKGQQVKTGGAEGLAWTGTDVYARPSTKNCNNWSSSSPSTTGLGGSSTLTLTWSGLDSDPADDSNATVCSSYISLFCFEDEQ